jgi:hypothetical protein
MDTTSINELPTVNSGNNITMTQNETGSHGDMQTYQPIPLIPQNQGPGPVSAPDQGPIPGSVPGQGHGQGQGQGPGSIPTQMHQTNNASNINNLLERARDTGSLSLPSRDIPMDSSQILQDSQALPDYIPNNKSENYIEELVDIEELQEKRRKERNNGDSLEELYKELQVPIFIGILFFIFNLPITSKLFHKYFTFGHNDTGSLNLQGYLVKSFLFASIYYISNVFMTRLSNI